ncbi:hypothetical protein [Methylococcus capsulatus]|uniref:Uncharacterized protein n=1 Tax=Methylococcus capsulatus TaxID=414 RepID=A0AA35URT4_METCP|nr:hypothetical protein [Methylococcus capsulatus]QXP87326.1 hypothetical protein KW112_13315 [Methylococcus capsulatus]QXP91319.1 hypothetical protein KW114_03960 [Methylococcus capsulatus]QXP92933.1 hypothetical protein KW113_11205 [Methylococcus capsulatus]UQN12326.1 hypothetical protein M3M30_00280 [Methylococcus capsulatus]CAI8853931.1 conserved membrane protein of unknown function [Methylococcus capsulatus]
MRTGKFYLFVTFVILLVIAIEGELVVEILSHTAELLLEAMEMLLDTVFEAVLGLTPRGAQVLTAWLAVGVLTWLGSMLVGKIARGWDERQRRIEDYWRDTVGKAKTWYMRNRLKIILIGACVGLLTLLALF